jgi:aminoglycoside/choline kinase family phosphotransferase
MTPRATRISIIGPDYDLSPTHAAADHAAEAGLAGDPLGRHFRLRSSRAWSLSARLTRDAILAGRIGSLHRVRNDTWTAIRWNANEDPDAGLPRFFAAHRAGPVTEDSAHKRALFEDLGDTSLYAYLTLPRHHESIEGMYRDVLRSLVTLHTTATAHVSECPLLEARIFDYDYLRWETTYFLDRFVIGLRKVEIENRPALDAAFHRLAQCVFTKPKVIIHRDFQCQNIMVHAGGPRIIDYQGARLAPPAYDVASILWDPYHRLDDGMRERLLAYYLDEMKADRSRGFDEPAFRDSLVACRLQRHMQALGAYGFLSEVKGKKYFLKHVPEALRLLREDVAAVRQEYPELARLIASL